MAKVTIPVKIDGISTVIRLLSEMQIEFSNDLSEDYRKGFTDGIKAVKDSLIDFQNSAKK